MPGSRRAERRVCLAAGLLWLLVGNPMWASPLEDRQALLLASKCIPCHARPETTAPQIGVEEDWQPVLSQGEHLTLRHVVEGLRGMPPLGYCSACSEEDLRALIRFLVAPGEFPP